VFLCRKCPTALIFENLSAGGDEASGQREAIIVCKMDRSGGAGGIGGLSGKAENGKDGGGQDDATTGSALQKYSIL
jgi:hypothetical protein